VADLGVAAAERVEPGPILPEPGRAPTGAASGGGSRGASRRTPRVPRADSVPGDTLRPGPAIVEERETTAVIRPGWTVEVAADGSLVATRTEPREATR
jgi:N-methylhydantoinase A